ncbi:MAG: hypothetical protein IKJ27_09180 [Clostridia bacterium]|nr:hypothetical protein [Clostridia bacterium]
MFNNISEKIKTLANVMCWIDIIVSVIISIFIIFINLWAGLICLILGPLVSWIGSFVLYGFGTLIENSEKTTAYLRYLAEAERKRINKEKDRNAEASAERTKNFSSNTNFVKCLECRNIVDISKLDESGICPWCGCEM